MALALQNIHRVIRQEDGEGDESVVVAPTADSGLPLLLPPPTTSSTRTDAHSRTTEGVGSGRSSSPGSDGDGGNQGLLLNKKKRFIPEPARKNGPNSKRRKKSNASPFHAVRQQRETATARETQRARAHVCVCVHVCMCVCVCVCVWPSRKQGRKASYAPPFPCRERSAGIAGMRPVEARAQQTSRISLTLDDILTCFQLCWGIVLHSTRPTRKSHGQ